MRKIMLLTLHSQNNNFGSVLQAYALNTYLKKYGDVEILDYRPYYSNGITSPKRLLQKIVAHFVFLIPYIIRSRRFRIFVGQQRLSKRYKSYEQLQKDAPIADIYMIGSDQVWNPQYLCGNDNAYYLRFTNSSNKISYAASVGQVASPHELAILKERIKDFKAVSMREAISAQQLQAAGLPHVRYVLDPVFLLSPNDYQQLEKPIKHKKYILAYVIQKESLIAELIDIVAQKLQLPVVQIGGFASKCNADYIDRQAGPGEFLSYVANAQFIITSSFHGTAFSIIYNKQFIAVAPPTNRLRLDNILASANLTNRLLSNKEEVSIIDEEINYQHVNEQIEMLKNSSKQFIELALAECNKH